MKFYQNKGITNVRLVPKWFKTCNPVRSLWILGCNITSIKIDVCRLAPWIDLQLFPANYYSFFFNEGDPSVNCRCTITNNSSLTYIYNWIFIKSGLLCQFIQGIVKEGEFYRNIATKTRNIPNVMEGVIGELYARLLNINIGVDVSNQCLFCKFLFYY